MGAVPETTAEGADSVGSWARALDLDELWEGEMTAVTVGATSVLLVNVDGQVRAYVNRCPHQEWALDEGDLDGRTLTCSRHLWEFDVLSGEGINPDNCRLTGLDCRVEDGAVLVRTG